MAHLITNNCRGCTLCSRYCPAGAITGEKKQIHVIDPALCIDCGACGRVCAFGAVLNPAGETVPHIKVTQWPRPVWDEKDCVACNVCVEACPVSVIGTAVRSGKVGRTAYPHLADAKRCLGCAICASQCPLGVIHMQQPAAELKATAEKEPAAEA